MQQFSTVDSARDDLAAQLRFESFRMGKPLPASKSMPLKHSHARSHSRNASVSSVSLSHSKSTSSYDLSSSTTNSMSSISSKRGSHHRRRSSVSTRTESAEIMGVTLPDLPEDNNVGDKDIIRRRALWALEGKPDASYSKVEIPELSTPEMERKPFDFPTKPSFPAGSGSYGGLNNLMGSKRDSFKLLGPSSSAKDQLHTLVEEEEEEEWDSEKSQDSSLAPQQTTSPEPMTPVSPDEAVKVAPTARPRPVGLSLRPLSLTPETLVTTHHGLPTPSLTPSPRSGLRSLSLTPSPLSPEDLTNNSTPTPAPRGKLTLNIQTGPDVSMATDESRKPIRRSSISYKRSSTSSIGTGLPTPEMTPTFPERRFPALNHHTSVSSVGTSSSEEDFYQTSSNSHGSYHRSRPLSASEQHFLFKSHNALLSRIQDLERALSVRRESVSSYGSRPMSTISVADSETSSSEPSDEMLRLVADLKAERDELKRDVDGWRTRVGDLEKQIGTLGKRVDGERREAWVARSRVSVLEAEKGVLEKEVESFRSKEDAFENEKVELEGEVRELKGTVKELEERKSQVEDENVQLRNEIERLRRQLHMQDTDVLSTPTPKSFEHQQTHATQTWKRALSMDTEDSATDVDVNLSFDGGHHFGFSLKSVDEESEDYDVGVPEDQSDDLYEDESEEDALVGYEDEEDSDLSFQSQGSSSSFGSEDEFPVRPRSVLHLDALNLAPLDVPVSPITPISPSDYDHATLVPSRSASTSPAPPTPPTAPFVAQHRSIGSLSKTWSFPRVAQSISVPQTSEKNSRGDDVDRFFGCLEDAASGSDSSSRPVSPSIYDYENSKGLFVNAMGQFDDDDIIPFTLPPGVGVEEHRGLDVVIEEEEDEEDDEETRVDEDDDSQMFGMAGGIKFTFTPPMEDLEDVDVSNTDEFEDAEDEEEEMSSPQPVFVVGKPVPIFVEDTDEEDEPFFFGRPMASTVTTAVSTPPSVKNPVAIATPPPTVTRAMSSPSSIPRPTISKSWSFPDTSGSPSSPSSPTVNYSAFVTPPTKRGGAMPSFIPQPVSPPTPVRNGPTVRPKSNISSTTTTFIRQPARKPLMAPTHEKTAGSGNSSNGSTTFTSKTTATNFPGTMMTMNARSSPRFAESDMFSFDRSSSGFPIASSSKSSFSSTFAAPNSMMKAARFSSSPMPHPSHEYPLHEDPSHSSASFASFSSIVTSPPKLFQKTFSNLMSRSWTAHDNANGDKCDNDRVVASSPVVGRLQSQSQKPVYVAKERQIERLRVRMQSEGLMSSSTKSMCKKCDGDIVYL